MGDLTNLVFVIVALLAWGIKVAVERKEQQKQRGQRRSQGEPGAPPDSGEVDVIVGRSALPEALAPRPRGEPRPTAAPAPVPAEPALQPARSRTAGRARTRRTRRRGARLSRIRPDLSADDVGTLEQRHLESGGREGHASLTDLRTISGAPAMASRGASVALWKLGVRRDGHQADMLRIGVLWSEVLGVPRAHAGPHQSPAARRMAR